MFFYIIPPPGFIYFLGKKVQKEKIFPVPTKVDYKFLPVFSPKIFSQKL